MMEYVENNGRHHEAEWTQGRIEFHEFNKYDSNLVGILIMQYG